MHLVEKLTECQELILKMKWVSWLMAFVHNLMHSRMFYSCLKHVFLVCFFWILIDIMPNTKCAYTCGLCIAFARPLVTHDFYFQDNLILIIEFFHFKNNLITYHLSTVFLFFLFCSLAHKYCNFIYFMHWVAMVLCQS